MLGFRHIGKSAGKRAKESGKELQKLTRQDLLSLLLDQTREVDRLRDEAVLAQNEINGLNAFGERLKAKLDDKDAQLNHLKARLDDKDVALQQLFDVTREMATANNQAERLALLLKAEEILTDRYFHQSETTAEEVVSRTDSSEFEEVTVSIEENEEPVASVSVPAEAAVSVPAEASVSVPVDDVQTTRHDALAFTGSIDVISTDPAPSTAVDYLYVDPTPLAHVEEVR